jgi:hypothetical protein
MPAMPAMHAMPAMTGACEWETHSTNEGRPYYYNKFTQQSVWEMPPEVMMSNAMMMMPMQMATETTGKPADPARLTAALINGHPVRPGMPDCSFFVSSGLCKFGEKCKYNHPPEKAAIPPTGMVNGKYPIRPNKPVCQYWTSTGDCKFGEECSFNHPPEKCNPSGPLGNLTVEPYLPKGGAGGAGALLQVSTLPIFFRMAPAPATISEDLHVSRMLLSN